MSPGLGFMREVYTPQLAVPVNSRAKDDHLLERYTDPKLREVNCWSSYR